ncbi:response regulator [Thalassotalea sp. LPB0316]|uniref:response regulator n=1 Tax=Thalassotalea sp. LPB0316 TaxID=2769490 RepID=UPI0018663065|nr:response regulator [Thalassotalea sp. LPB0316]QOL27167.1 response regulator [Thalassotalea sp. LPB0316]
MLNVLVIDDKKPIIDMIERLLSAHHINVISANNGLAATELLHHHSVELIICDHLMPIMNGLKFVENYFSHNPSPKPVIFMTTQDIKAVGQLPELKLVTDIFAKPLDLEHLEMRVKEILSLNTAVKVL